MGRCFLMILMLFGMCMEAKETTRRLGIDESWFHHRAGASKFNALHSMLYYQSETIYDNHAALNFLVGHGASSGNLNGKAPLVGVDSLSTIPVRGGMAQNTEIMLGFGYYLGASESHYPLYIGTGVRQTMMFIGYVNAPAMVMQTALYFPLELHGNIALSRKVGIEYLAAYDFVSGLAGAAGILTNEKIESRNIAINSRSDAVRLMFGMRYYVSKSSFFFAQVYARFESAGASQAFKAEVDKNSQYPGSIKGASAQLYYPKSHTSFVGLRVGFGF